MKDLTNHHELAKQIPETAREFRFNNMILKITKSKNDTYGMVVKNIENPKHHHTFVAKNENLSLHYTKESDGITPNRHKHIDYQEFQQGLAGILQGVFSTAQKISLDDPKLIDKYTLMFVSQKMVIAKKTAKKVIFDQEVAYEESLFQDIDTKENRIGFTFDENDVEQCMIIIQNGEIFKIDVEQFDAKNSEMDKVFRPEFIASKK